MNRTILLAVFCVILTAASTTHAAIVQIAITARVSQVDDTANLLEGNIAPDDLITGTYTYDSDTPDTNPLSTVGDYWHNSEPFGVQLIAGSLSFESDFSNIDFLVELVNNAIYDQSDGYIFISYNNLPVLNNIGIEYISWQLDDPTGNAISSINLPTGPPILSDWQSIAGLTIKSEKIGVNHDTFYIKSHVESAVLVPEPGMICLSSIGVLGLMRRVKH